MRFQELRQKILHSYSGQEIENNSNLPLRAILYLYKIDVLLSILNRTLGRNLSAKMYYNLAQLDARSYQANECLRMVYNSDDLQWKQLQEYHKTSTPVRLMLFHVGLDIYGRNVRESSNNTHIRKAPIK